MTTQTDSPTSARPVKGVYDAPRTVEGGGFEVYRPLPSAALDLLDPFLLLDEMAPTVHPPGHAVGAPDHPHRGFETVTYILDGEVEHRDSAGNHGVIGPGDVQWMTAGDGVVHSEMPSRRFQEEGGRAHGVQLWVNLPSSLKRTDPRYQALPEASIPTVHGEGWSASVVAGSMLGVDGPAETHTPVGYARVTLEPAASVRVEVFDGHTAAVYALNGAATVGPSSKRLVAHQLAVFDRSHGDLLISADPDAEAPLDALLLTGEPIGDPVARYGPFVMNTRSEIVEAIDDFNAGRMGTIAATKM
jgi:hypothetical protein